MAEKKESYSEEELNEMIVWFNNHADELPKEMHTCNRIQDIFQGTVRLINCDSLLLVDFVRIIEKQIVGLLFYHS